MYVMSLRLTDGSSKRCSNAPPTSRGSRSTSSISASAVDGGNESACRKKSTSPRAAAAPAFNNSARVDPPGHDTFRGLPIAGGGDDDLALAPAGQVGEMSERTREGLGVVPRRDDDRHPRCAENGGPPTVHVSIGHALAPERFATGDIFRSACTNLSPRRLRRIAHGSR